MIEMEVVGPDDGDWQQLIRAGQQVLSRTVGYTAQEFARNVRRNAPVDHGRLAGSWKLDKISDEAWRLHTNVVYAETVSKGQPPHEIVPKTAKALRFEVNGQVVFAKRVKHPGTAGNPYVEESFAQALTRRNEFIRRAIADAGG